MKRAGFWIRTIALLLDVLLFAIPAMAGILLVVAASEAGGASDELTERLVAITFHVLLLSYAACEVVKSATPGKMILGLTIVRRDGSPADRWMLALRWTSKYSGFFLGLASAITTDPVTSVLGGIANMAVFVGCLYALGEDHRTWHDEWAGTAVYRRIRRATTPPPLPMNGSS